MSPSYVRDNRPELVETRRMRDGLPWVFGLTGEAEGLGTVEGDRGARLALRGGVSARESSLFSSLGLSILASYDTFSILDHDLCNFTNP